jgi:hypothetical protein
VDGAPIRSYVIGLFLAALVAMPAGATSVHPGKLVAQEADVPAGVRLIAADSGRRTNRDEVRSDPRIARVEARAGRLDGYVAVYWDGAGRRVNSRADLYRRPGGARDVLAFADAELRKSGIRGLRRSRVKIGSEGWIYWGGLGDVAIAVIAWRHNRVFAAVATSGLPRSSTLAIARKQQRRIATVIR